MTELTESQKTCGALHVLSKDETWQVISWSQPERLWRITDADATKHSSGSSLIRAASEYVGIDPNELRDPSCESKECGADRLIRYIEWLSDLEVTREKDCAKALGHITYPWGEQVTVGQMGLGKLDNLGFFFTVVAMGNQRAMAQSFADEPFVPKEIFLDGLSKMFDESAVTNFSGKEIPDIQIAQEYFGPDESGSSVAERILAKLKEAAKDRKKQESDDRPMEIPETWDEMKSRLKKWYGEAYSIMGKLDRLSGDLQEGGKLACLVGSEEVKHALAGAEMALHTLDDLMRPSTGSGLQELDALADYLRQSLESQLEARERYLKR